MSAHGRWNTCSLFFMWETGCGQVGKIHRAVEARGGSNRDP